MAGGLGNGYSKFSSWTTGSLKLPSPEIWKEQVSGDEQKLSLGRDGFEGLKYL